MVFTCHIYIFVLDAFFAFKKEGPLKFRFLMAHYNPYGSLQDVLLNMAHTRPITIICKTQ